MIQANELRIGNYINYITKDVVKVCKVDSGLINELDRTSNSGSWYLYNGIPLTEELLLKCGFVSNPYQDTYVLVNKEISFVIDIYKVGGYLELYYKNIELIYLHDLQNVFYYHNNKKELEINL